MGVSILLSERVLPICISVDHVLGLVEVLNSLGGRADASHINDVTDVDADVLSHAIDLAEWFGLLKSVKGDLILTDLGREVARSLHRNTVLKLRDRLSEIEPFKTILGILNSRGKVDADEIAKILEDIYGSDTVEEAFNCVTGWGLFFGIFRYDHRSKVIIKI